MDALNLGSGQRPFKPPWQNYDIQVEKWKEPTIEQGCLWINDPSKERYDMICLHHVIEHFGCNEADGIISDCRTWLKPGGSLLVFAPNIRALMQRWLVHQLDTQILMTNIYGAYMGDEADRHKWGYDMTSLLQYLRKFRFAEVRPFDWREIPGADIARDFWIAGVECIKPKVYVIDNEEAA